jgi:hypothetical protein
MAMRRIYWGVCRNWFLIDPLHYLSSRSDFGFEFAEIFVIEKRLPDSASRGVGESGSRRVGFGMFKRKLGESESRYGESGSRYSNFLKFFSQQIRLVAMSLLKCFLKITNGSTNNYLYPMCSCLHRLLFLTNLFGHAQ